MSKMAAFFAGLGSGYLKADRQRTEDERTAKKDAQDTELFNVRMDEINQTKSDKQALRDAGAERTTMQGTAVTDGGGNRNLYADPMQASAAAEDAKIEAEMRGQQPSMVNMQAATGITGKMATGHQITTEPVDLKAINGAEAKAGRFQAALDAQGKPLEAMQMSTAAMDLKAKALGLETAQLKHLNTTYNNNVLGKLKTPGSTLFENGAKLLGDVQFGGLAGVTTRLETSKDGKTVSIIGSKDGKDLPPLTFPNNATGEMQLVQRFLKADEATQISYLKDGADREAAQAKAALDERRVAAVEQNADTNSKKLDGMLAGMIGGRSGAGRGNGAGNSGASGVPLQEIYKRLESDFTVKDPTTGESRKDVGAIATVRNLVLQMPAAQAGDVDGAYLQAMQVYQKAQAIGKGDPVQTQQALTQILGGGKQEAYPKASDAQIESVRKVHGGDAGPAPKAPDRKGMFTGQHGETQLLQPFFNMSDYVGNMRKKMQDQSAGQ